MNPSILGTPVFLVLVLMVGGCSGFERVPVRTQEPRSLDVDRYRANAKAFESESELEAALLYWKVIRSLGPADAGAEAEIERLLTEIQRRSTDHFRKGREALNKGRMGAARRELLEAIRIDSQNTAAIELLKSIENDRYATHVVKPKETFRSIAEQHYSDKRLAPLVARFNDLDPGTPPVPGAVIRIPKVDAPPPPRPAAKRPAAKPQVDGPAFETQLDDARRRFAAGEFEGAARTAERLLAIDPSSAQAAEVYNASLFHQAKQLRDQQRYSEAMAALESITQEVPGLRTEMRELRGIMNELAEEHYRAGVQFFVDEELEMAIAEWEKAVALNPNHEKAVSSIAEAKGLLEALRKNRPVLPRP